MNDSETSEIQEEKNRGGRPLKFKSVEELDQAIAAYFDMCDPHTEQRVVEAGVNERGETIFVKRAVLTEQKPYTVSGLARALGIHRETLINYGERDEFSDSVRAAYERCHEFAEAQLYGKASSGAAFSLKNNWGWKDKHDYDHTSGGKRLEAPAIYVSDIAPRDNGDAQAETEAD